jgi:hypothetical protein
VFSRRVDPRFGEPIYRLMNITRAEPDASLFEVPADYKREDMKPIPSSRRSTGSRGKRGQPSVTVLRDVRISERSTRGARC